MRKTWIFGLLCLFCLTSLLLISEVKAQDGFLIPPWWFPRDFTVEIPHTPSPTPVHPTPTSIPTTIEPEPSKIPSEGVLLTWWQFILIIYGFSFFCFCGFILVIKELKKAYGEDKSGEHKP